MKLIEAIWKKEFWTGHRMEVEASVLFPGSLPPLLEELGGVPQAGLTVELLREARDVHWAVRLAHPEWGLADAICFRNPPLPPRQIIEPCVNLTRAEKEVLAQAGSAVIVRLVETTKDVLGDRKRLFRFAGAVMDPYGTALVDRLSWLFWSRQSIEEELAHDAKLDISALYVVHAVRGDDRDTVNWLHTHGLAEIGFFDFDIIRPSKDLLNRGADTLRAIAFGIIEGTIQPAMSSYAIAHPAGTVSLVPVEEFARKANGETRALWDDDHRSNRSVLCEPNTGVLRRWFPRTQPSRFLSQAELGEFMVMFSNAASELMAERARATYGLLRSLFAEFRDLNLPVLVKLRFDLGSGPDAEHMWFSVRELNEDTIDGTLENDPFHVRNLRRGDRGKYSPDSLSDWAIFTPAGSITPRDFMAAREVRDRKDEFREMMKAAQAGNDA